MAADPLREHVAEAEQDATQARAEITALEDRVRAGDLQVTPGHLAEAREWARIAELRVEAAKRKADEARRASLDERARALREDAARLVDGDGPDLGIVFRDAVRALSALVRVAQARRETVAEMGRVAGVLASEPDGAGMLRRHGVSADHERVHVHDQQGTRRMQTVAPYRLVGAAAEVALDPQGTRDLLQTQHAGHIFGYLPALAEALGVSEQEAATLRGTSTHGPVLVAIRDRLRTPAPAEAAEATEPA